jgi:ATP adenylyltransferase
MEILHAPGESNTSSPQTPAGRPSLFTRIAQSSDDIANLVIARDRSCFALLNAYPYNGGHLLVVPYRQPPTSPTSPNQNCSIS